MVWITGTYISLCLQLLYCVSSYMVCPFQGLAVGRLLCLQWGGIIFYKAVKLKCARVQNSLGYHF